MKPNKTASFFNNFTLLKIVFSIAPWRVVHEFIFRILDCAQWAFFTVVFMRYLFGADVITQMKSSGTIDKL